MFVPPASDTDALAADTSVTNASDPTAIAAKILATTIFFLPE